MRVGIIQSNYIPWRGYFDFVDDVDLFIFHDDLQYTKGDWRNRNRIKTPAGLQWLTVPVHYAHVGQLIDEVSLDESQSWRRKHLNLLEANYRTAPYFQTYFKLFADVLNVAYPGLSKLNIALIRWVMNCLEITTPTLVSKDLNSIGSKTTRLIDLLKKVNASIYLSGPAAAEYLDLQNFVDHGIRLEYKSYDYPAYEQIGGEFAPAVSILDLLFNTGPHSRKYLKSQSPNQVIVP
jgi:hypothetical protein